MPNSSGPRPDRCWEDGYKVSQTTLEKQLHTAIISAFNPHPTAYSKVVAVLIHFDDEDIGVGAVEDDLATTFQQFYKFAVKKWVLQSQGNVQFQSHQLLCELGEYLEHGCLIILVYSGQAKSTFDSKGVGHELILGGRFDGRTGDFVGKELYWRDATSLLKSSEGDVLEIMDCCFASEAASPYAEVLAVTSAGNVAVTSAGSVADSYASTYFLKALNEELQRASSGITTMAGIHAELIINRRNHNLQYTPVLVARPNRQSITLQKLGRKGKSVYRQPTTIANGPRILVTAQVEKNIQKKDCEDIEWSLSKIPEAVKGITDVKLEGAWPGDSTLLLFSLPIAVWTQLPNNPAWNYVGVVNSSNIQPIPSR